jgi:hypothetical protein
MKRIFLFLTVFTTINCFAQQKAGNQKQRLSQYIGNWVSTDNINDTKPGVSPNIKMNVTAQMDSASLQVEVLKKTGNTYKLILVELISYDAVTDQIVAAGQNASGQCFIGRGFFDTTNQWIMQDENYKGEQTVKVTFNFINNTTVSLKGEIPNTQGWQVKYIKMNSK